MRWVAMLLSLGGVGLYIAARFGTHALIGRGSGPAERARPAAGGIALGHWAPTVAVSMTALFAGRADLAIAVAFAVSVAALLLALGMTVFLVPSEPLPTSRRVWPFLLPAGLLIVVAGFGSALNLIHAVMLAVLGVCVLGLWRSLREEQGSIEQVLTAAEGGELAPPVGAAESAAGPKSRWQSLVSWRVLQWALSVGLAMFAGWTVVRGTLIADAASPWLRAGILVAGAISPLLVLPLLAIGTDLAQKNQSGEACSACVGLALLNLLGLVPLLIVAWAIRSVVVTGLPKAAYASTRQGLFQPATDWFMRLPSLPLPLTVWRIDAIVITVVGFALLPAALGKWRLGRMEAVALIAGYAGYLAVSAFLTVTR
ncbi:hypothetical protein [Humisphaera borealis]|uniref:Sodium/calcium exchanger membrane region domain-containing protein n=1 Tax=Humisphaera borealis TaxID=2807512 RepID=A0A7M2X601_9BACT|nr:hypothetical protein [Humisphaera borealis]QOV92240.1 hypothetical protein IPV69_13140 [Humisphaera borealis]